MVQIERTNAETLTTYTVLNALVTGVVFGTLRYLLQPSLAGWHFLHELILFGVLAYSLQPLWGILSDHLALRHHAVQLGVLLVCCGILFPSKFTQVIPLKTGTLIKAIMLGLGYCMFQVSAAATVLRRCRHRCFDIGCFTSSGVLGTMLFLIKPTLAYLMIPIMMFTACRTDNCTDFGQKLASRDQRKFRFPLIMGILLIVCFLASMFAFSFTTNSFTAIRQESRKMILLLTVAVFAGRLIGGWLLDHIGTIAVVLLSVPSGMFLLMTKAGTGAAAGLFLLNLSLPALFRMTYEIIPDAPGFAYGLISSIAFPAVVLANRFPLAMPDAGMLAFWGLLLYGAALLTAAVYIREFKLTRMIRSAFTPKSKNTPGQADEKSDPTSENVK